jgi:hypothetical protein
MPSVSIYMCPKGAKRGRNVNNITESADDEVIDCLFDLFGL